MAIRAGTRRGQRVNPAGSSRAQRHKRETRRKLLGAAHTLMARQGIDATTIQQITDEADVGFGSFYNYFASKDAIVEVLCADTIDTFGDALDTIASRVDDHAEVLAASVRYAVRKATTDETWGWFLIRTGTTVPAFDGGLVQRMARDVRAGIRAGRFDVVDVEATIVALGGIVLAIIGAHLRGDLRGNTCERAAVAALLLLGLPGDEAREISTRPLPEIIECSTR